jgi:peptide/nickel transport system permease protein
LVGYVVRRIVTMIPMMVVVSILSFVIIQLPPGDFLTCSRMSIRDRISNKSVDKTREVAYNIPDLRGKVRSVGC